MHAQVIVTYAERLGLTSNALGGWFESVGGRARAQVRGDMHMPHGAYGPYISAAVARARVVRACALAGGGAHWRAFFRICCACAHGWAFAGLCCLLRLVSMFCNALSLWYFCASAPQAIVDTIVAGEALGANYGAAVPLPPMLDDVFQPGDCRWAAMSICIRVCGLVHIRLRCAAGGQLHCEVPTDPVGGGVFNCRVPRFCVH